MHCQPLSLSADRSLLLCCILSSLPLFGYSNLTCTDPSRPHILRHCKGTRAGRQAYQQKRKEGRGQINYERRSGGIWVRPDGHREYYSVYTIFLSKFSMNFSSWKSGLTYFHKLFQYCYFLNKPHVFSKSLSVEIMYHSPFVSLNLHFQLLL